MAALLLIAFYGFVVLVIYYLYQKYRVHKKFWNIIDRIPGPPALFFFGNTHQFSADRTLVIKQLDIFQTQYGKNGIFRFWFGHLPVAVLTRAHTAEIVLSSNKWIEKSTQYDFLKRWIGDGLLISGGEKWRYRRKMLTPTFHFSILSSFVDVYNRQSNILIKQLKPFVDKNEPSFNIFPYIGRCALDIICETAMGICINAQMNHKSEYVQAVVKMCEIVFKYERMPWLRIKPIFNLLYGKQYRHCMEILRQFIKKVICDRIDERADGNKEQTERKRRLAFLDLLLDIQTENKLTYEDIREEVDTFMFEGHDTTSSGMGWALYMLGHHKEAQDKAFQEIDCIFGDDNRDATEDDIKNLKYLECVIKETLRLYPPVPFIGRKVTEPFEVEGYQIPVGAMVTVAPYFIHRDPKIYGEDYLQFKPERFDKDTSSGRHPYAYVPFSAGSRNCIGQKFALMEEKVVLSSVLRHYEIVSLDPIESVPGVPDLILRPPTGFNVRLKKRQRT